MATATHNLIAMRVVCTPLPSFANLVQASKALNKSKLALKVFRFCDAKGQQRCTLKEVIWGGNCSPTRQNG